MPPIWGSYPHYLHIIFTLNSNQFDKRDLSILHNPQNIQNIFSFFFSKLFSQISKYFMSQNTSFYTFEIYRDELNLSIKTNHVPNPEFHGPNPKFHVPKWKFHGPNPKFHGPLLYFHVPPP